MIVPPTRTTKIQKIRTGYIRSGTLRSDSSVLDRADAFS